VSIAAAVFLAAVGAILYFAVNEEEIGGVDLQTVGVILMIAGAAGFLLTMLLEFGGRSRRTERIVERGGEPVEREDIKERY
jgi:predicted MFS family arabinose efflux permease